MKVNPMFNPISDPYFPIQLEDGAIQQVSMKAVLLGNALGPPQHPDPAIQAFFRYIPSLFLQALNIEMEEDEWKDLVLKGTKSDFIEDFRERVEEQLDLMEGFFDMHADQNGFYQHHEAKAIVLSGQKGSKCVSGEAEGLDGLLTHSVSGNNHTHFKVPSQYQMLCPSCALVTLIHHNNFCVAGLAGPANIRGNQAYLCMVGPPNYSKRGRSTDDDTFKRMVRNTIFSEVCPSDEMERNGWDVNPKDDAPSWIKAGKPKGKGFEVSAKDVGLLRAVLHTPRNAFFEWKEEAGHCDFCGLAAEKFVHQYYWRIGDKMDLQMGHPALATYEEKGLRLPLNFSTSIWRSLGALVVKNYQSENNKRSYQPAPLVSQYRDVFGESLSDNFCLELQCYQTDKAKLEGFHQQTLRLPVLPKAKAQEEMEFYQFMESFTTALAELFRNFRYWGSADTKSSRVQIPHIVDKHDELVQSWGESVVNRITDFRTESQKRTELAIEMLDSARKVLMETFIKLGESFAWEDASAQRKLRKQQRQLNKTLGQVCHSFKKSHSESQEEVNGKQ